MKFTRIDEAIDKALELINEERSGEQLGLYSGWNKIDRAMGKYWRFNNITLLAAPSGHGKSFFLNQLIQSFTDNEEVIEDGNVIYKPINGEFKRKLVVLYFNFEMDSSDEVLRTVSRIAKKSYHYLLSSEYNQFSKNYNKISDKDLEKIKSQLEKLKNKPIYYFDNRASGKQILKICRTFKEENPDTNIILAIDHYLLAKKEGETSKDMELIADLAGCLLEVRKETQAMILILGQLNQNILGNDRLSNPSLHYPVESDIYMGAQIRWICDNVWIVPYRPELFNIQSYSPNKIPTENLVVASCVKSRKGFVCEMYLNNDLKRSAFTERKT